MDTLYVVYQAVLSLAADKPILHMRRLTRLRETQYPCRRNQRAICLNDNLSVKLIKDYTAFEYWALNLSLSFLAS